MPKDGATVKLADLIDPDEICCQIDLVKGRHIGECRCKGKTDQCHT